MSDTNFSEAMMAFTDQIADLAGAIALHRTKLIEDFNFSQGAAEAMCVHVHMKMVELMCTPSANRELS